MYFNTSVLKFSTSYELYYNGHFTWFQHDLKAISTTSHTEVYSLVPGLHLKKLLWEVHDEPGAASLTWFFFSWWILSLSAAFASLTHSSRACSWSAGRGVDAECCENLCTAATTLSGVATSLAYSAIRASITLTCAVYTKFQRVKLFNKAFG